MVAAEISVLGQLAAVVGGAYSDFVIRTFINENKLKCGFNPNF